MTLDRSRRRCDPGGDAWSLIAEGGAVDAHRSSFTDYGSAEFRAFAEDDLDGSLLIVVGELDMTDAEPFRQTLCDAWEGSDGLLHVDLQGITFMGSGGLRALIFALNVARERGGDLRLRSPSERVQRVLELSGLDSVFAIDD